MTDASDHRDQLLRVVMILPGHWWMVVRVAIAIQLLSVPGTDLSAQTQVAGLPEGGKLEAIVALLRSQNLQPGRVYRFRLDNELNATSLMPLQKRVRRGQGRGLVWAEFSGQGGLRVVIETQDKGRAGESGFLFSDTPVNANEIDELGREWTLGRKLSPNWWMVHYRLG